MQAARRIRTEPDCGRAQEIDSSFAVRVRAFWRSVTSRSRFTETEISFGLAGRIALAGHEFNGIRCQNSAGWCES